MASNTHSLAGASGEGTRGQLSIANLRSRNFEVTGPSDLPKKSIFRKRSCNATGKAKVGVTYVDRAYFHKVMPFIIEG